MQGNMFEVVILEMVGMLGLCHILHGVDICKRPRLRMA